MGTNGLSFLTKFSAQRYYGYGKKGTVTNITPYLQHLNLQKAKALLCKYLEDFLWYGKNIYHSDLVVENIQNETTQSNLIPQLNTFNFIRHLTDF